MTEHNLINIPDFTM